MVDSTKFKTREEPAKQLFGQFERSLPDSNEVTPPICSKNNSF